MEGSVVHEPHEDVLILVHALGKQFSEQPFEHKIELFAWVDRRCLPHARISHRRLDDLIEKQLVRLVEVGTETFVQGQVGHFCAVYFKSKPKQSPWDHQAMNAALDPAVARFATYRDGHEAEAENWRSKTQAFLNLYGFVSQIIPYQDSDLERLYVFLRHHSLPVRGWARTAGEDLVPARLSGWDGPWPLSRNKAYRWGLGVLAAITLAPGMPLPCGVLAIG